MTRSEFSVTALRPPRASRRLAVVLLSALLLALLPHVTPVAAQTQDGGVSLRAVELPPSAFPAHSHLQSKSVGNTAATVASGLHGRPFSDLLRLGGAVQTASWLPITRAANREAVLTLQYVVSIFPSAIAAAAAAGDAQASLWELGSAAQVDGLREPEFTVKERTRHSVYVVIHRSAVEAELRLRYGSSSSKDGQRLGLTALRQTAENALRRIAHATQNLTLQTAARTSPLPPIFVAPWGAGPVVKSPSLMAFPSVDVSPDTPADPGAFRSGPNAPLASEALPSSILTPEGGLSRFVKVARNASSPTLWYDSVTLYQSPADASAALAALIAANRAKRGLRRPEPPILPTTDERAIWQMTGETILAFRTDNVLTVLAGTTGDRDEAAGVAQRLIALVPSWLHTSGTAIVDATEQPVHLSSLNWYGAEQQDFVVGGLDFQPYQAILQTIRLLGYNTIRLPFSDQLVQQNPVVTAHLAANPELSGLHALDIIDRIVGYAGALGLSVILDNHRSEAGWSSEPNGLWYSGQYTDAVFVQDWTTMATRYAVNNVVIGTDLRNEPHAAATWGDGNGSTDWHAAAQRAGNAVLAANPNLLVIVEGIQFYGTAPSAWWGANLMGVATAPVVLQFPDGTPAGGRLVYSAHDYGPDMCGGGCPWFGPTTTYASLASMWDQYWGYIAADPTKPYAAPVWIGEFGTCNYQKQCVIADDPGSQGQWFSSLVRYLAERHLSWSYWSANGTQSTGGQRVYGALDWYGLLRRDWSGPVPWVQDALGGILTDAAQGRPSQNPPPSPAS